MNYLDSRLPERFWNMTQPCPMSGCWLWLGATKDTGYGVIGIGSRSDGSRRTARAHRLAYEALVGPVPDGLELDHKCRQPCCVNPAHLEPVTHAVNVQRGRSPEMTSARCRAMTHCKNGHEYTPENTMRRRTDPSRRECWTCIRARAQSAA